MFSSDSQQEGLDISVPIVPTVSSVPSQKKQPPEAEAPVPARHALQTGEITEFWADGVAVDEMEKCCFV